MRIFFSFILLITAAIPGFTQVGTKEEAIQAAMNGAEPEYIRTLMERLSVKIDRYAAIKEIQTPTEKLVWLSTMQGIIERAQTYAFHSAIDGAWYLAAGNYAANAANRAALERAHLRTRKAVWSNDMKLHADSPYTAQLIKVFSAAKHASVDAALIGASREEIGQIAYRVAEWEILNWLLENFETEIEKINPVAERIARGIRGENPFISEEDLIEFYNEQFEVLDDNVIRFLAPWLIHLVPPDRAGRHEALFFDLHILNAIARGR